MKKSTHFLRDKGKVAHTFDTFESSQGGGLTPSSHTFAIPSTASDTFETPSTLEWLANKLIN